MAADVKEAPKRFQLRRTKGWRLPDGAVSCARPGRYGNPFSLSGPGRCLVRYGPEHEERFGRSWDYEGRISSDGNRHDLWFSSDDIVETYVRYATREEVVELCRLTLTDPTPGMVAAWPSNRGRFFKATVDEIIDELAGRDLGCWCGLDQVCHVDVLLEIANGPRP